MIYYIKGSLEYISDKFIIVENNGIGYNIKISNQTRSKLKINDNIKIFTFMNVKEDELSLYGFLSIDELNMFNLLITVSGIGPKGALAVLNTMTVNQIALAIITNDAKALKRCQGIGDKAAQRIILELKDKIKTEDAIEDNLNIEENYSNENSNKQDAIDALIALGFGRSDVVKIVMSSEEKSTNNIIKAALKKLGR